MLSAGSSPVASAEEGEIMAHDVRLYEATYIINVFAHSPDEAARKASAWIAEGVEPDVVEILDDTELCFGTECDPTGGEYKDEWGIPLD